MKGNKANRKNDEWMKSMKSLFGKNGENEEDVADENKPIEEPEENAYKNSRVTSSFQVPFKKIFEPIKQKISLKTDSFADIPFERDSIYDEHHKSPEEENIDFCALAAKELTTKKDYFSALLDITADICEIGPLEHERLSPEKILRKWDNALGAGECKGLAYKIQTAYEDKKPETDIEKLGIISKMFNEMGLKKLDFPDGKVTVSIENRAFFENGKNFPDGCLCVIERYVWFYNDDIYVQGILSEIKDTETDDQLPEEQHEAIEEGRHEESPELSDDTYYSLTCETEHFTLNDQNNVCKNITVPMMGCSAKLKDADTFVLELIINYNNTPRFMDFETAKEQIYKGVKTAVDNGFKKTSVFLVSGDSLKWDCFKELCDYVGQTLWEIPVELCAEIYGSSLNPENEKWLFRNLRKVNLTFCITENNPLNDWRRYSILYHPMVSTIRICVVKDNLDFLKNELSALLEMNKQIQFVFSDLHKWKNADYQKFLTELSPLLYKQIYSNKNQLFPCADSGCMTNGRKRLIAVDTDSSVYFCRFLSMEHLMYSNIPEFSKTFKCGSVCPAAEKFKKNQFFEQLINLSIKTVTDKMQDSDNESQKNQERGSESEWKK